MQVRELIQLKIESLNYSTNAVGRSNGFIVFVPYGVPGDTLLTRIVQIKKNYAIGEMVEIITPSPYRTQPPCVHFSKGCGGCQWQYIIYDHQLHWKKDIVLQALKRIGKLEHMPEAEIFPSANPFGYRNKLRLFTVSQYGNMLLGMKKFSTHNVVPIKKCPIANDSVNEALALSQKEILSSDSTISELTIRATNFGDVMLTCLCARNNRATKETIESLARIPNIKSLYSIVNDKSRLEYGNTYITESILGKRYRIGVDSFFQVNNHGLTNLIEITKDCVGNDSNFILDAHCGVGTFAIQLAELCDQVWGIDISSSSIELAIKNASDNNIENATFRKGSAIRILNGSLSNKKLDAVILDPPRSGCDKPDLLSIIHSQPKKIVYISCNPTTLARDLNEISQAGYKLKRLAVIDMFPMTYHLETLVFCER